MFVVWGLPGDFLSSRSVTPLRNFLYQRLIVENEAHFVPFKSAISLAACLVVNPRSKQ
ncbi:unnamed protein product [Meloidogyne enterolobii]|uniref:Uncharacterized protein n=1 Tax=Meloidogyne enterolobii TaxID=390850 RepID=A0ACB0ZAB9_MELEN